MPKNVQGGPFLIYKHTFCCKKQKTQREDHLGTLKNFRKKSRTVSEKNRKGDSLVPSGFVGYLEKIKIERGPFALSLPWRLGRTWRLRWFQ